MLSRIRNNKRPQLVLGLGTGFVFGFLLQKSGVTNYDVILGQLLLRDFTVMKMMLSAVIAGMIGVHALRSLGWVSLHPKPGSIGTAVAGGLLFGVGFAVLGYCPGTLAGAVGQGALDAAAGGVAGLIFGSWLFATVYPHLQGPILSKGDFGAVTIPELLRVNAWHVVIPVAAALTLLLTLLERSGL